MINVLLVTGSLHIGGMETVAMNIARYLDSKQFRVDFLVYGDGIYEHENEVIRLGGRVFRIPFPHNSPLTFERNVRRVIRENGPYSVVHCHNLFNCGVVMRASYKEHVPVRISHSHTNRIQELGGFIRRVYEKYSRLLMKRYGSAFFACSRKAGEYLFGKDFASYGFVLRNGVNPTKYMITSDKKESLREQLGVTGKKVILQIGTFDPVKNHLFSVRLMTELVKRLDDVVLLFAGDGEMFSVVREAILSNNMENHIIQLGKRADIPELLAIADMYLMPSQYEGVSLALVEAQTSGVPCLVSQTACAPEVVISDGITSLSLDEGTDVWVQKMIECIDKPRSMNGAEQLSVHGYDIRQIIEELGRKYIDYLNEKGD